MKELLLFATGIIVGAMNGIAGGGMLIGFPILIALGLPPLMANATSAIITAPGQITSAFGYRNYLRKVSWRYSVLLIPTVIGGAAGALLLRHTTPDHFKHLVPFLVLLAVLLFAFQPFLHAQLAKHLRGKRKQATPLALIGLGILPVALYGGYFGAGYGFLMLAFLSFTRIHDIHQINGMKNVAATFMALASVACLYSSGLISWHYGFFMGAGSLVGGYVGAISAQKVSSHAMRIIVLIIGISAVIYLGIHDF